MAKINISNLENTQDCFQELTNQELDLVYGGIGFIVKWLVRAVVAEILTYTSDAN
ncbi:hypothetical protein NSTC745_04173 [Nostoc sp. DSM 114161]|jgi:bacteriocin-like protein|uniref:bacteriocin n=1 Tax=Nostoc sp. DSM 114161 TaxID=3440143 RepID=UPI00404676EC